VNLAGRHPSTVAVARFYAYDHLPLRLQGISKACHDLCDEMLGVLPDDPELTAGLRKLLEAKDCFVRLAAVKE